MQLLVRMMLLMGVWLCITTPLFSQPPDDGDTQNAPIDGGLSILIAAGAGYAVKKGYEKRKKAGLTKQDK